jgi:class 3 adenylate cyclase/tetratricopeptide (TPR) repeat protein
MQVCPNCGEENPPRFRLCGFCGTTLAEAPAPQEVRKTVTIVFSDLKGSTSLGERLDSEALREVMSRYFDAMRAVLEEHGGRIEKFIGDAVMAVFGLPRVHEDDALRAVRAALGMKEALARLNDDLESAYGVRLANRTGVNTGEVVAGDPSTGQRLVTGDTVNVAARLEQAAPELEVLIGQPTYRLVRDSVEVEEVEPLELKGKSERIPAYRLIGVGRHDLAGRGGDGELVAREAELALLLMSLADAKRVGAARLATVVGEPGLGKSRLSEELFRLVEGEATVLRGRCLAYGRGITFWPLVEIVRSACAIRETDPPDLAYAKLAALARDQPEAVERVASATGLGTTEFPLDEINWGTRKLLEALARDRPLVVFVDDCHWAEDAFLDLLEHVAANAAAPMLLVCATRPELLGRRDGWSAEPPALRLELEPLTEEETVRVIEHFLGGAGLAPAVRRRIVAAAEGNPLYVEQLLSMLVDDGLLEQHGDGWRATGNLGEIAIPGTIQALLAARLELLSDEERAVLEPASVVGGVFARAAVTDLAPEPVRGRVPDLLDGLVEKRLVRRDPAELDEDLYRFQHILIRDTAYQGLLKRTRASLHERFADWAEAVNRDRDRELEYEEILGYHLEQAHRYLRELGPLDEHGHGLGARAAGRLGPAGRRALGRGDMAAAGNLLGRASQLLPARDRARLELLPDLGEALMETGEFGEAERLLDEAVDGARELGDDVLGADAVLTRLLVRHHAVEELDAWRAEVERETDRIIPTLDPDTDAAVLAKAWRMVAFFHGTVCEWEATAAAEELAIEFAILAGEPRQEARLSAAYMMALCDGPMAVPEAIERGEKIVERGLVYRQAEALVLLSLASLRAMGGEFGRARSLVAEARELLGDLGAVVWAAATSLTSGRIELTAGEAVAAETELRRDYEALGEMDERFFRPLVAALLAQSLCGLGRFDEAAAIADEADALASPDDVEAQALVRSVRAKVCLSRGELEQAERLAREALEQVKRTDAPVMQADALLDLAAVLLAAGKTTAAQAALEEARSLYALKEHTVGVARAEAALGELAVVAAGGPARAAAARTGPVP